MLRILILILKLKRRFIWAKYGEQWSWKKYEYELYKTAREKMKRISESAVQELINVYWFLSYGGFPENPAELEDDLLARINNICCCSYW